MYRIWFISLLILINLSYLPTRKVVCLTFVPQSLVERISLKREKQYLIEVCVCVCVCERERVSVIQWKKGVKYKGKKDDASCPLCVFT